MVEKRNCEVIKDVFFNCEPVWNFVLSKACFFEKSKHIWCGITMHNGLKSIIDSHSFLKQVLLFVLVCLKPCFLRKVKHIWYHVRQQWDKIFSKSAYFYSMTLHFHNYFTRLYYHSCTVTVHCHFCRMYIIR